VATDMVMPVLSESMAEGTVVAWLKSRGDEVAVGDDLVEIESDKAVMVYRSDTAGVLLEILAEEGETLPVGSVIARIGAPGEPATGVSSPPHRGGEPSEERVGATPEPLAGRARRSAEPDVSPMPPRPPGHIDASPVARRLAADTGVDLSAVVGTGPGGRITREDVERASPSAAFDKGAASYVDLTGVQAVTARRLTEAHATVPQFHVSAVATMDTAHDHLARLRLEEGRGPTVGDIVVMAAARALVQHPLLNGSFHEGRVELYARVNVGIAVPTERGLLVPTLFDADRLDLREIAERSRTLIDKARDGSLTPVELSAGTFTVSNLGVYDVESFAAIINPPQAAILAIGRDRPPATGDQDGAILARSRMTHTQWGDHRVVQ